MIFRVFFYGLMVGGSMLQAQAPAGRMPGKEAMQNLFNPQNTREQLDAAVREAGLEGVNPQVLAEAKLMWALRDGGASDLESLLPELQAARKNFRPEAGVAISSADEFGGLLEFVLSRQALLKGDEAGFKKHIQEAFWLSPAQAAQYAELVQGWRKKRAMASVKLDLSIPLTTSNGEATTLREVMAGQKAILIDFWASWCGPCMTLMPELRGKAEQLAPLGVLVVGMNTDQKDAEATAERIRQEKGIQTAWLVEPANRPYSRVLEIASIPQAALVGPDGRILFLGHPQDPQLWVALKQVNPAIEPPK